MMFARESPIHAGRQSGGGPLTPFSPISPISPILEYSPQPHDLSTPASPVKMKGGQFYPTSPTTVKLEPMSPTNSYQRSGRSVTDSQPSPCASSLDSNPYSPMNGGGPLNLASSPMTSPRSPSSPAVMEYMSGKIGRDDLSPASSVGSFGSKNPSDKKKKGSLGRHTEDTCLVCGDRASGFHYNALTCEGCKGFFRRSVTKRSVYKCKYGDNCEMDMYMRRKCQECRFKKCISVGMREDCVVPESKCQAKRKQKKARGEKGKTFGSGPDSSNQTQFGSDVSSSVPLPFPPKIFSGIEVGRYPEDLIRKLLHNQDEFESPSKVFPDKKTSNPYDRITEMTKLTVELIVSYALSLPGFEKLSLEDKLILLKSCSSEVIVLRASRRYHLQTDTIVFSDNMPCTRDFYRDAGLSMSNIDAIFDFCRKMAYMEVDNAEYALLAAIDVLSERPTVGEPSKVEELQNMYVDALYAYVTNRLGYNSHSVVRMAKLLDILRQLRYLGSLNYRECESLVIKNKNFPPLLKEMWDIKEKK